MSIAVGTNGTTTLTGSGTEDTIIDTPTAGVYVPNISLANMVNGDVIRLRIYKYDSAAGTAVLEFDCEYANVQNIAFKQCPMIDAPYGFKWTMTQITGTGRACKRFVSQLDS